MAAIVDQLRQMHGDLERLATRDPEQEVRGVALPLVDAVLSEAKMLLPEGSTLARQIVELVSPESINDGDPIRAADALLLVGQLLAVFEHHERQGTGPQIP